MGLGKWYFKKELIDLCVKCTSIKPSTAKKYARKLFDKHSTEKGCISYNTQKEYRELQKVKDYLSDALNTLKLGYIVSNDSVLKLEDVSHVEFKKDFIEVYSKNNKLIRYGKGFEYLKYVFNYNQYYY